MKTFTFVCGITGKVFRVQQLTNKIKIKIPDFTSENNRALKSEKIFR